MRHINIIKKILSKLPIRNVILFESNPDVADNSRAVFNEMIRRGMNNTTRFVWIVENDYYRERQRNVKYFVRKEGSRWNLLQYSYYLFTSKCLISCNCSIGKERSGQYAFYLTHGTPIKTIRKYFHVSEKIDYMIAASGNVRCLCSVENSFPLERVVALGYPRNDELTNYKFNLNSLFRTTYKKIIVWYPTYRQNKYVQGIRTNMAAIPIICNEQSAEELNNTAKKENVLIIMKPHFAQDISLIRDLNLSNIWFINDSFFEKYNLSSYQFVGNCDALLTDYSSIYYDYTLCDKPIAVIWEDIEEYKKVPGFAVDLEFMMRGAEKIYSLNELKAFISRVAHDVDLLREERNEIKGFVNYSDDGKNSVRVVDFILQNVKSLKG